MFIPDHFRNADEGAALAFLARYPFATLVTAGPDGEPLATSLPMIAERREGRICLMSHLARRNPHAAALEEGQIALLVANGPNGYISPQWYQNAENVPTWNYVGLQARGQLRLIADRQDLFDLMRRTTECFEVAAGTRWKMEDAPDNLKDRLIMGVLGFEIVVDQLDFTEKLSQNKRSDHPSILMGLRQTGAPFSQVLADVMQASGP